MSQVLTAPAPTTGHELVVLLDDSGLDYSKTRILSSRFADYFTIAEQWKAEAQQLIVTGKDQTELMLRARQVRLVQGLIKRLLDLQREPVRVFAKGIARGVEEPGWTHGTLHGCPAGVVLAEKELRLIAQHARHGRARWRSRSKSNAGSIVGWRYGMAPWVGAKVCCVSDMPCGTKVPSGRRKGG